MSEAQHRSVADRLALGKEARVKVPRRSHASWKPGAHRKGPVVVLEEQAKTRVPELVPIRHGRMLVSPFAFFRGAAGIMAGDLAATPHTGLIAQLCGDAHLTNFGVFAAPDRRLVFDLNDFDETLPGPWEWDVKRLVASFEVAMRERGFDRATKREILLAAGEAYRVAMAEFAERGNLEVWYARLDAERLVHQFEAELSTAEVKRLTTALAKARKKTSLQAFEKLTVRRDGKARFANRPPLLVPLDRLLRGRALEKLTTVLRTLLQDVRTSLSPDRRHLLEQYELVDLARKVVGVGSVGTRAYVALLRGRDDGDPLLLQFKEAEASVLEPILGKSQYPHHGLRVIEGQRLIQATSDILLGCYRIRGVDRRVHDYYVRQLWDGKGSPDPTTANARLYTVQARACGWALARAHARSGDRIAIAAYLGKRGSFAEALADFAHVYAEQNERDYDVFRAAVKSGRLVAEKGT